MQRHLINHNTLFRYPFITKRKIENQARNIFENCTSTIYKMLEKLRNAVKKVKILLNINLNIWRLSSILGNGSLSLTRRRTISFNDRPGLRACTDDYDDYNSSVSTNDAYRQLSGSFSSPSPTSSHSSGSRRIERTTSCPSEDDIDKRAEMFINNFRRRLVMERQASLQLRYLRGNSFDQNFV